MKKTLLIVLILLFSGTLAACERTIPDYTVDEAFSLMNEAIGRWLDADSFVVDYASAYAVGDAATIETMSVRLKRGGTDALIALIAASIEEPSRSQTFETHYEDGAAYTARDEDGSVTKTRTETPRAAFEALYRSFLKTRIDADDVRAVTILVDADRCSVRFEFDATRIADTFHVPSGVDSVGFATVTVGFTHAGVLQTLDVSYETVEDDASGTETYSVVFSKLDRYVVIARLSASEKADYAEAASDAA